MTLYAVRGLEKTSESFRRGLAAVAADVGADATALAAVMSFETGGSFSPSIRNPLSGAVGLIQFTRSTARQLGTTDNELADMTREQQLTWVHKYLRRVGAPGRLRTVADHYAAVFAPAFIGKPDSAPMYRTGAAYDQNKPLDANRDHIITKGEAARSVVRIYNAAKARGPLGEGGKADVAPFPAGTTGAAVAVESDVMEELKHLPARVQRFSDEVGDHLDRIEQTLDNLVRATPPKNPTQAAKAAGQDGKR